MKGMRDKSICSRQTEESDSDIESEFGYSLSTVCCELSTLVVTFVVDCALVFNPYILISLCVFVAG